MEDFSVGTEGWGGYTEGGSEMDVDGQAAVGDQLTTDGGSAFGLRRGGMVAWKYCSQMRHSLTR